MLRRCSAYIHISKQSKHNSHELMYITARYLGMISRVCGSMYCVMCECVHTCACLLHVAKFGKVMNDHFLVQTMRGLTS